MKKRAACAALACLMLALLGLSGCGEEIPNLTEEIFSEAGNTEAAAAEALPDEPETPEVLEDDPGTSDSAVAEGVCYYDLEHVVLFLDQYGALPDNYITKEEAARLAGRAAASKITWTAQPSAATASATGRGCFRRRRGAATPNATSIQTAN